MILYMGTMASAQALGTELSRKGNIPQEVNSLKDNTYSGVRIAQVAKRTRVSDC